MEIPPPEFFSVLNTSRSFEEAHGRLRPGVALPHGMPVDGLDVSIFGDAGALARFQSPIESNPLLARALESIKRAIHFFRTAGNTDGVPDRISMRELIEAPAAITGGSLQLGEMVAALGVLHFMMETEEGGVSGWIPWASFGAAALSADYLIGRPPVGGVVIERTFAYGLLEKYPIVAQIDETGSESPSRARAAIDIVASFNGDIYFRQVEPGEVFYRYTSQPDPQRKGGRGHFVTNALFSTVAAAREALNVRFWLNPERGRWPTDRPDRPSDAELFENAATYRQMVVSREPAYVFEGEIENGKPGVRQVVLLDLSKFEFSMGEKYEGPKKGGPKKRHSPVHLVGEGAVSPLTLVSSQPADDDETSGAQSEGKPAKSRRSGPGRRNSGIVGQPAATVPLRSLVPTK